MLPGPNSLIYVHSRGRLLNLEAPKLSLITTLLFLPIRIPEIDVRRMPEAETPTPPLPLHATSRCSLAMFCHLWILISWSLTMLASRAAGSHGWSRAAGMMTKTRTNTKPS